MWGAGAVALAGVALALVFVQLKPEPTPPKKRPNVLIILWDTVRADRLSVYGYDRPTTPRLEEFAQEAVVYEHAWSPGIWTLAAHSSVFTGLPVESTGADERHLWLDHHHTTLAEHFSANGYDTFAFAANALLSKSTNLVQGFRISFTTWQPRFKNKARQATRAKLIEGDRSNELSPLWSRPDHGAKNSEWAKAHFKEAGPLIGKGLLHWLDVRPDPEQPWVAYLNLMEAHTPRIPSMKARKAVIGDQALIDKGLETDAGHINLHFYNFGKHEYDEQELAAINAVYDASLRDLDDATGDLLDALEARGVLDDTIVVLTSDHGENLGDHHLFNHRFALWDSLLHVPLVIRYPDGMEPGRVSEPVSTQDVFGTVVDLAGLPAPLGEFHSRTLRTDERRPPVAFMARPLEREVRTVQRVYPDVQIDPWMRSGHAILDGSKKLIQWKSGLQELYDLELDPGETTDRAAQDPTTVEKLARLLDARRAATPEYDPSRRDARDDPSAVAEGQDDLREQLEALGYVAEDEEVPAPSDP